MYKRVNKLKSFVNKLKSLLKIGEFVSSTAVRNLKNGFVFETLSLTFKLEVDFYF